MKLEIDESLRNYNDKGKIIIYNSTLSSNEAKNNGGVNYNNKGNIIIEGDKYTVFKEQKLLKDNGILVPKIIEFENYVLDNKKIKLGYRDDINDLIKDILRNK